MFRPKIFLYYNVTTEFKINTTKKLILLGDPI